MRIVCPVTDAVLASMVHQSYGDAFENVFARGDPMGRLPALPLSIAGGESVTPVSGQPGPNWHQHRMELSPMTNL